MIVNATRMHVFQLMVVSLSSFMAGAPSASSVISRSIGDVPGGAPPGVAGNGGSEPILRRSGTSRPRDRRWERGCWARGR